MNQPAGNSTEKPAKVLVDSDGSQAIDPIMQHGEEGTTMNLLVNGIANNSSWRAATLEKPNWGSLSNNQYASNNNRYNNFLGGSKNKRYFNQRNNKQKDRHEEFKRSSRQDHPSRGKNGMASSGQKSQPTRWVGNRRWLLIQCQNCLSVVSFPLSSSQ
jgi:hypothetical protein